MNECQRLINAYLMEEDRARAKVRKHALQLTDEQRLRLAVKGDALIPKPCQLTSDQRLNSPHQ